ncbi:hypothetical protein [Kordia sp.]|uniref:hypothetical protein n=1 Tax=Kordia sp. TaxID=1965332 RepID=UPI0025BF62DB|nr:hypothetical protein [Kordia sp.]MCH2193033.1 hypothetical protein [Kordia sp.]
MSKATTYITALQLSILFVLAIVLIKATRSSFLLYSSIYEQVFYIVLAGIILYLFNALYYNGKRMLQIKNKAIKENTKGTEVWKLWSIPIIMIALGFILLNAA